MRAPSRSSWGVRPERRTSGSVRGGSSGPRWGTRRWQNWQRMGLLGQIVVRWWARSETLAQGVEQAGQERGVWNRALCLAWEAGVLPWEES